MAVLNLLTTGSALAANGLAVVANGAAVVWNLLGLAHLFQAPPV